MRCSVTLTADEFKVLHNTLWDLGCIDNSRVQDLVEKIRNEALKGAYQQDNAAFETKHDYYRGFQGEHKLRAIWSIYETPAPGGFLEPHPYPSDAFVCYKGQHVPVFGDTWGDVYRAADWAIRNSGDDHHIFVESFTLKNGNELHMGTGS